MKVAALAGGVGGAKLLIGLQRALPAGALTAVVNTGDDSEIYGVHVSPDIDIVTYWLAGIADTDRGWGIEGDTFRVVDALSEVGHEAWFRLGDRDFATCLFRTEEMNSGRSLAEITDAIRTRLGVPTKILPMSNDPVRTHLTTDDGRRLPFQEYFVKERHEPVIASVDYENSGGAAAAPGVLSAIREAELVVICPSNPILSIGPILAIGGVRAELARHPRVIGVTPIIRGSALKGPADRLLTSTGGRATAAGVAELYADVCDLFVVDASDEGAVDEIRAAGKAAVALPTVMKNTHDSERLAWALLDQENEIVA